MTTYRYLCLWMESSFSGKVQWSACELGCNGAGDLDRKEVKILVRCRGLEALESSSQQLGPWWAMDCARLGNFHQLPFSQGVTWYSFFSSAPYPISQHLSEKGHEAVGHRGCSRRALSSSLWGFPQAPWLGLRVLQLLSTGFVHEWLSRG